MPIGTNNFKPIAYRNKLLYMYHYFFDFLFLICNLIFQVASAMYIIDAVEILMVYIVGPQMSLFGPDISIDSVKFNNFRVYGTFFVMGMYIINLFLEKI